MPERNNGGMFVSDVSDDDVMDFIDRGAKRPFVTTSRIAGRFGFDQSTAYRRLQRLVDEERLNKESVGANAVVWWPAEEDEQ